MSETKSISDSSIPNYKGWLCTNNPDEASYYTWFNYKLNKDLLDTMEFFLGKIKKTSSCFIENKLECYNAVNALMQYGGIEQRLWHHIYDEIVVLDDDEKKDFEIIKDACEKYKRDECSIKDLKKVWENLDERWERFRLQ